jgi:hypothetical protein
MRSLSLLLCFFVVSIAAHSRVLTLNNNNPSPGQYTTWSDVYGATISGDTILVQESPVSYGSLYISFLNRSLVIIGAGHRPQTAGQYGCFFDNLNIYWTGGNTLRISGIRFTYGNLSYAGGTTLSGATSATAIIT